MVPLSETIIALYSEMVGGWQLPLYWFAAANIQYIFFFGLAVFAMMCSGNRFGATILYGIANFGSLLVYLLVDQVYTPLLKGVVTLSTPFYRLCPIAQLTSLRFADATREATGGTYIDRFGVEQREYRCWFEIKPDGWIYTAILAAVGIALLLLARQMYKKRQLEKAGDFLAVRWLEPVFQVVFTILCGSGFHAVFLLFFGQCLLTNFIQETVLQFFELPVLWINEDFNGNGNILCRGQDHQRFAPLIGTILDKTDTFPEAAAPLVTTIVKLGIQRTVFSQKDPGTFFACAVTPELRVNAEFHNEALAVLRSEDYRHSKTDVLPIPVEEQEVAAILRPAMNLHHVIVILRTKEVFKILVVGIGKDVPLVVDVKLLPKDSNIGFRDCFTDGNLVFHLHSSRI